MQRIDYTGDGLSESDLLDTPYDQVRAWVDAAVAAADARADGSEPTALSVATADTDGAPDVRTVLMRFLDERGPGFLTNLESTKSRQLAGNPKIAASLTWPALYRSIRFRGQAELIERPEVESYFRTRPYGSRLSAWASEQSRPTLGRAELEARWAQARERFPETGEPDEVPVPDFWGGWRIVCDQIEFWAGRTNRLHDRIVFTRIGAGDLGHAASWRQSRLQP
ncbi:MAG: pyridoxamine 5'-phosphate oxidase [Micrococcales bacterium]|nr:pyridoxamine 5'-phosphate oxidase [Micrococcales bacterium]